LASGLLDRQSLLIGEPYVGRSLEGAQSLIDAADRGAGALRNLSQPASQAHLGGVNVERVDRDIVTVAAENGRFDDSVSGQNHGVEGALQAISHVLLALLAELEEDRGASDDFMARAPNVTRFGHVVENLQNAGLHPLGRVCGDADGFCDPVGRLEANTANVERQAVGLSRNRLDRPASVSTNDADGESRARSVRLQKDHDVAQGALLAPSALDGCRPLLAEAIDFAKTRRSFVEHPEGLQTERFDDPLRELLTHSLDKPGREILLEPRERLRGKLDQRLCPELRTVRAVLLDPASDPDARPNRSGRKATDHSQPVRTAFDGDLDDSKPASRALERDALDDSLDDGLCAHSTQPYFDPSVALASFLDRIIGDRHVGAETAVELDMKERTHHPVGTAHQSARLNLSLSSIASTTSTPSSRSGCPSS
jgi:hypothetical protein